MMLIDRWSEERATEVDHEALMARAGEAREMSGDVGEDPEGRRVGVSSLRGQKSDWVIRSARLDTLVST